ncbi:HupE/UreJ family protein [Chamaesiphon sp. VAR_48_metabat_135_sub]|uniref:HupE/UreJ family protein n=1 Tax=Chamaesiphon sp. VAR_48_metabat_135_sub TaxID=2964699 RepID=UPI0037BEABC3
MGLAMILATILGISPEAIAHGVTSGDKGYIQESTGVLPIPFIYLGAKHMMTGYDHLLFLFGVIFYLYRREDVAKYVTLFAVGHVITLLSGVLFKIGINAYIIDTIIGFSIVYKALDNMGAFQRWFGFQPNPKVATLVFGLFHGFGLATKILEYDLPADGLLFNLIFFNVGVEVGQLLALGGILIAISYWRKSKSFLRHAYNANVLLMMLGFLLMGYQMTGYFAS